MDTNSIFPVYIEIVCANWSTCLRQMPLKIGVELFYGGRINIVCWSWRKDVSWVLYQPNKYKMVKICIFYIGGKSTFDCCIAKGVQVSMKCQECQMGILEMSGTFTFPEKGWNYKINAKVVNILKSMQNVDAWVEMFIFPQSFWWNITRWMTNSSFFSLIHIYLLNELLLGNCLPT